MLINSAISHCRTQKQSFSTTLLLMHPYGKIIFTGGVAMSQLALYPAFHYLMYAALYIADVLETKPQSDRVDSVYFGLLVKSIKINRLKLNKSEPRAA